MITVSNTSPIISLARIGQLNLLGQLYKKIIIPTAVYGEIVGISNYLPGVIEVQTQNWIEVQTVNDCEFVNQMMIDLDAGESEAIALAIQLKANRLLLDERRGRAIATSLGIPLIGVLGILKLAKNRDLITTVKPLIDDLIKVAKMRISANLYDRILQDVNEKL